MKHCRRELILLVMKNVSQHLLFVWSGIFLDICHWNLVKDWGNLKESSLYTSGLFRNNPSRVRTLDSTVYTQPCVYVQLWTMRYFLVTPCNLCAVVASFRFTGICIITIFCFFSFFLNSFFSPEPCVRRINIASVKSTVILLGCEFESPGCNHFIQLSLDVIQVFDFLRVQWILFDFIFQHHQVTFKGFLFNFFWKMLEFNILNIANICSIHFFPIVVFPLERMIWSPFHTNHSA